jgi:cysteine desulfurase / selenocysteine lyase
MNIPQIADSVQSIDGKKIRADFPILAREVHPGVPLVYLDSAATSQKPNSVIETISDFYRLHNANIHRAVHTLAEEATDLYEAGRQKVADWIGAERAQEIIFTRNATEAINLVAQSWGRTFLAAGDVILLTEMEHHSNLVPWQILAEARKLRLEFIPITGSGELDLDAFEKLLLLEPKLIALTQMSNVLGTVNPVREIVRSAHRSGAKVLVDAAQSVAHMAVNVRELDADFVAFSAHKMCGPTGIGALYGKRDLLLEMPPFMGGGDMIRKVEWRSFEPNDLPYTFEAGTPPIAEAVGWGAAVDYLKGIGIAAIHHHEQTITRYALQRLNEIPGLKIIGPDAAKRGGIVAFTVEGIHPHDIAQILDSVGVAVRSGHHCTMPLHRKLDLPATTRASFYLYTIEAEIDALIRGLEKARKLFA